MLYKKQLFNLNELKDLLANENSCVSLRPTTRLLELPPCFLNDIKKGIFFTLTKSLKKYDLHLDGILIGYQKVKILLDERTGMIPMGGGDIRVNVSIEFFVFQPKIGGILEGVVNKKGNSHVGCLVHKYFNASILKPVDIEYEDWDCKDVNVDDRIKFKVCELDFTGVVPRIEGVRINNEFNDNFNDPNLGMNLPNRKDEDDDEGDNYEKELLDSDEFWNKKLNKQNWMPDLDMNESKNEMSKRIKFSSSSSSPDDSDVEEKRIGSDEIEDGDLVGNSHRKKKRKKTNEKNVSFLDEVEFMNSVDSGRKKSIKNSEKDVSHDTEMKTFESNIKSDLESSQSERVKKSGENDVEPSEKDQKDQVPSTKKVKKSSEADGYLNVNVNLCTPEKSKKSKRKSLEVKDTEKNGEVSQILSPKKGCNDLSETESNQDKIGNKAKRKSRVHSDINDFSNEVQTTIKKHSNLLEISSPKKDFDSMKSTDEKRSNSVEINFDVIPALSSSKKSKSKKHNKSDLEREESVKSESKKTKDEGDSGAKMEPKKFVTSPVLLQPSAIKKLKEGSRILGKRTREPGDEAESSKKIKRKRLDFDNLPSLDTNELQMSLIREAMKSCLREEKEREKFERETSYALSEVKTDSPKKEEKSATIKLTETVDEEGNKKESTPRSKTKFDARNSSTSKEQKKQKKVKRTCILSEKTNKAELSESTNAPIHNDEDNSDLIKSLTSQAIQRFTEWDSDEDNVFRTPKQKKKTKTAKSLSLSSEKKEKDAKAEGTHSTLVESPRLEEKTNTKASKRTSSIKPESEPENSVMTPKISAKEKSGSKRKSKTDSESVTEALVARDANDTCKVDVEGKLTGVKDEDVASKDKSRDNSHEKLIERLKREQLKSLIGHEVVKVNAKKSKKHKKEEKVVKEENVGSLYTKLLQDALSNLNERRSSSRERSSKKKKEKKHKKKKDSESLRHKEKKDLNRRSLPLNDSSSNQPETGSLIKDSMNIKEKEKKKPKKNKSGAL